MQPNTANAARHQLIGTERGRNRAHLEALNRLCHLIAVTATPLIGNAEDSRK
jgi:hypothetical protein